MLHCVSILFLFVLSSLSVVLFSLVDIHFHSIDVNNASQYSTILQNAGSENLVVNLVKHWTFWHNSEKLHIVRVIVLDSLKAHKCAKQKPSIGRKCHYGKKRNSVWIVIKMKVHDSCWLFASCVCVGVVVLCGTLCVSESKSRAQCGEVCANKFLKRII